MAAAYYLATAALLTGGCATHLQTSRSSGSLPAIRTPMPARDLAVARRPGTQARTTQPETAAPAALPLRPQPGAVVHHHSREAIKPCPGTLHPVVVPGHGLPYSIQLRLPPICRFEPPDPTDLPRSSGSLSLGDLAVRTIDGSDWMPLGFLDARRAPAEMKTLALVEGIDEAIRITDLRHFSRSEGEEWRVRIDSQQHASGGEHWVLVLHPHRSKMIYRLDWDNTHLFSTPGRRNPLFETIANHFELKKQ